MDMTRSGLKIAVAGSTGRMGRSLLEAVLQATDLQLSAALEQPGSAVLGKDAGELVGAAGACGIRISDNPLRALAGSQVLVDFTRPEGTLACLPVCREQGIKMVIGTTGFSSAQKALLNEASEEIAIVMASNMSVGVNVTLKLLEVAAGILNTDYDIEIVEAHHRHKVDAPSGTALSMGEVVARALGRNLDDVAVYGREGVTGERLPSTIGFATIRAGDIIEIGRAHV